MQRYPQTENDQKVIGLSVVSHKHGKEVACIFRLLSQIIFSNIKLLVVLTLNIPEDDEAELEMLRQYDFLPITQADGSRVTTINEIQVRIKSNKCAKSFGQNHNHAFVLAKTCCPKLFAFCILNPDITWREPPFEKLVEALQRHRCEIVYPKQLDQYGEQQDHQRMLPTAAALVRRHMLPAKSDSISHYGGSPDWVNAAFLMIRADVFAALNGFDESYRMYCEDVEFSLRAKLKGFSMVYLPDVYVQHTAHRASRRNMQHFIWHVSGLVKLWRSETYREYKACKNTQKNS